MDTELWFSSTVAAAAARHAVAGVWPSPCAHSTSRPSPARLSLPLPKSPAPPALFLSLLSVSTSSRVNEPSRAPSPTLRRPALAVPRLDSSRPNPHRLASELLRPFPNLAAPYPGRNRHPTPPDSIKISSKLRPPSNSTSRSPFPPTHG